MNIHATDIPDTCPLFKGLTKSERKQLLNRIAYDVNCYNIGDTIFCLMEQADHIGIILEGYVQIQKLFPSGSQINVSAKGKGELIGSAAVFSKEQKYPCDIVALEPSTIMLIRKQDMVELMQSDSRILQNFVSDISSATYMLQRRLELLSYSGIAQKIAFYLLIQARQTGKRKIRIPESVTNWAMIMNVSRPSLHRELKKMNDKGIIMYSSPFIMINDTEELQKLLGA